MKILKLEIEFTESSDSRLKEKYFNSKSIEEQIDVLDSVNAQEKRVVHFGYSKTYVYVSLEDGTRTRVRYDIGDEICFLGFLSRNSNGMAIDFTYDKKEV